MKYQFIFTVDGDDLQSKLEKAIEDNPKLHLDFLGAFSQGLIKSLKIQGDDNITIEGFKAVKVEGPPLEKSRVMESLAKPVKSTKGFFKKLLEWVE